LGNLSDKLAAELIRLALVQVGRQIEELDQGALRVPGLGTFKVRVGEQDKAGAIATSRRVTFRPEGAKAED
jgi:hypothetical protein